MLDLKNPNISYLLVPNQNGISSYLFSRDYYLVDIKEYFNNKFDDFIIAFTGISDYELKEDSIHIIENFNQEFVIAKFKLENSIVKFENRQEILLDVILYNTDFNKKSYIHEGMSFSFIPKQSYIQPKNKNDFKAGMIIEYLSSNNQWIKRSVVDPIIEFDKMYALLIKYNKIRILQ